MNVRIKIVLFAVLLILLGLTSQLSAQKKSTQCRLNLPDSSAWQLQVDDSSFVVKNRFSVPMPCGRHYMRLFRLNDRNWQRFIFADSVTFSDTDSTLFQLGIGQFSFMPHPFPVARFSLSQPESNKERWSFTWLFKKEHRKPALIVTAVAANWLSFYLKRRADDYYIHYRKSSNLSDMRRYYATSAVYDRYSAVALGISTAALSAFFYFFLSE